MKFKRSAAVFISIFLAAVFAFTPVVNAAVFTFETQYEYDTADYAWLTDLVIKEDMESISGVAGRVELEPCPDYPYTETADSLKAEVREYCSLYSLDESALKASYIYLIEMLGSNSSVFAAQANSEQVRIYLESIGISYPAGSGSGTDVLAKALYAALVTGAFSADGYSGASLEQALTSFVVKLSGFSERELLQWIPQSGSLDSLDSYVLAVSRLTLWSNGYDVTGDTPEDEVYKLMAVMTIRNLGYSVGTDVSFDELQAKYTAAMLGKKYGVTVDPSKLSSAIEEGSAAFYILQLIGQKHGLSVRQDALSYEEAFEFVAENTGAFDIEDDEFYADIYIYDAYLSQPRSTLWVYPTSYYGGVSASSVNISCAGQVLKDNYYTRVSIDPALSDQTLNITVAVAADGSMHTKVYSVNVHQDVGFVPDSGEGESFSVDNITEILSSGTIVSSILDSAGVSSGVSDAANGLFGTVSDSVMSALSFISPTFTRSPANGEAPEDNENLPTSADPAGFITILDRIGAALDLSIGGIDGLSLSDRFTEGSFDFDFITFVK